MRTNRSIWRRLFWFILLGALVFAGLLLIQTRHQISDFISVSDTLNMERIEKSESLDSLPMLETDFAGEKISIAVLSNQKEGKELIWHNFESQQDFRVVLAEALRSNEEKRWVRYRGFTAWTVNWGEVAGQPVVVLAYYPYKLFKPRIQEHFLLWLLGLVFSFLIWLYLYRRFQESILEPIDQVAEDLDYILENEEPINYSQVDVPSINHLQETVESLQRDLIQNQYELILSEERLSLLLDSINLGVVLINGDHQIELFNPEAKNLLALNDASVGRSYEAVINSSLLVTMIDSAVSRGQKISEEIELYVPTLKYVDVNIIPYSEPINEADESVLVLLYDISNLRRLEVVRTEFVANASHELRTPVTAIKGFAETLLDGALEQPEMARQFIQIIANESNRLETLIHDILDLSRIENDRSLNEEPFNLVQAAENMLELFQKKAADKEITLQAELPEEPIIMSADQHRVEQIIGNLIENAIKYSQAGDDVRLTIYSNQTMATLIVSDTGIGIPKEDQERIFERFYRVDKGRSRESGGTGLGLSIVRNLVNIMGGTINVESQVGEGSTFIVRFPLGGNKALLQ